ncbi:MAG: anhydro-N-acetylmuramic acid kinase [Ignavibacteria bacterium]|nr:anhydro-N-acetylmuramic acid kinase [Ignavibacteria bacterium]
MNGFTGLLKKKTRNVLGVLSGTSVDAVDIVHVRVNRSGTRPKIDVLGFESFPISGSLRKEIMRISDPKTGTVEDVCRMNVFLGMHYAKCIRNFLKRRNLTSAEIDLIGSHGQTIQHLPAFISNGGMRYRSTLQIGDPSVIANQTGITTVGDFRTADVAVGGSGAPLVPYLDELLFSDPSESRLLLNIGGISNLTYLPASSGAAKLTAFDTGPGNMLVDRLMLDLYGRKYDRDGEVAFRGRIDCKLLKAIKSHDKFHRKKPPKSTGREYYGRGFISMIMTDAAGISSEDIIATVSEFTAYCIFANAKNLKTDTVLVSGGGSKNKFIMKRLSDYFKDSKVKRLEIMGINESNKEAVLFALLANEVFSGRRTNIPGVTGAFKRVFLGKICPV